MTPRFGTDPQRSEWAQEIIDAKNSVGETYVPAGVLRGIEDIAAGRTATKKEVMEAFDDG